jgi:L-cysteine desulfhydrase
MLEPNFHHLNHGSYGAALKAAQEASELWRMALEASPSSFMEVRTHSCTACMHGTRSAAAAPVSGAAMQEVAVPALGKAVAAAAPLVGASPAECAPVANATTGITTVLRALALGASDAVLVLSCAYSAVKTAVGRAAAAGGATVVEVQFDVACALDPLLLVSRVRAAIAAGGGSIRAAVLDHVVSFPPVVLPLSELIAVCRKVRTPATDPCGVRGPHTLRSFSHASMCGVQNKCVSIIDGAHGIGNEPDLDVGRYTLYPDAYVTNLHKWLCTPKGTALLWVSDGLQAAVRPLVVSHSAGLGFAAEHLWSGTADIAAWLSVPAAVAVHNALGLQAQHAHRSRILEEGVAALIKSFGCAARRSHAGGHSTHRASLPQGQLRTQL